jgi:HK97 family phage major capsid protein
MVQLLDSVKKVQSSYDGKDMPKDVATDIEQKLDNIETLRRRVEDIDRTTAADEFMSQSRGTSATRFTPAAPDEGHAAVDEKSWREFEVKTHDGVRTFRYHVPLAVQHPDYKNAYESYLRNRTMGPQDEKVLREGIDSAGGFLVPEDMQTEIIKKVATQTVMRQQARIVTTSRDSVKWPRIKYTTDNIYTNPVRLSWVGEPTTDISEATNPDFGQLDIQVNTAMSNLKLSNDLIDDSAVDIEMMIAGFFGESFALGEEAAFWTGTGAGQPLGVLATNSVDSTDGVASVNSGSASTLLSAGLINLWGALPTQYERGARFYWRKSTEEVIRELVNSTSGDYEWPVVNQVGQLGQAEPTLLGFPVTRIEFAPAIAGDAFPILFGQLQGYIIVDRVGLSIQRLVETEAKRNQIEFVARKRVGGQVAEPWRMRAQKISNS